MRLGKISWGSTAAIITSMGLIAGFSFADHARASIVGGLLILAIADNIPDSLGIHIYKETETADSKEVLSTTLGNFFSRLVVTLSFVALALVLPINSIMYVTIGWGLLLLGIMSVYIAKIKKASPAKEIIIHLTIAVLIVAVSRYLGYVIDKYLG